MIRVGVIGASGYTGAELLRLAAGHPEMDVVIATAETYAGTPIGELYPGLRAAYGDRRFDSYDPHAAEELDLAFLGLPHGASQPLVARLVEAGVPVVDLAADFRLADAELYPEWYGDDHQQPELLADAVYGLPELFGEELPGAMLVAAAGCYPTAAALALAPLAGGGLIDPASLVVDAASGVSGAGRDPKPHTTFGAADANVSAYGLLSHRHTPEIEQSVARLHPDGVARVLFTPHLVPMTRGILATCYARPASGAHAPDSAMLMDTYRSYYSDEPFVVVTDGSPSTKAALGANTAHVTARYDQRTGWFVAICAIDNLVKGASGQALQCANVMLGYEETAGLPVGGVWP